MDISYAYQATQQNMRRTNLFVRIYNERRLGWTAVTAGSIPHCGCGFLRMTGQSTITNFTLSTTLNLVWIFWNFGIFKRWLFGIEIRNPKTWTDRFQEDVITNSDEFSEMLSHYVRSIGRKEEMYTRLSKNCLPFTRATPRRWLVHERSPFSFAHSQTH